jgi:hypothetical protein
MIFVLLPGFREDLGSEPKGFLSFFASDGIERPNAKLAIAYSKLLGLLRALRPSDLTNA